LLAHKLITIGRAIGERESVDLVQVSTAQLCQAMGAAPGVELERLRQFAQQVAVFLQGYDLHVVCGCGYLSLLVGPRAGVERALAEQRDLTSYAPEDIEAYLDETLDAQPSSALAPLQAVCDIKRSNEEP
jgi:hypothetical protein